MILFVAPYAGELPENSPFLAAARKIRFLLRILKSIDSNVVLLNSAHRMNEKRLLRFESIDIGKGDQIVMATPRTFVNAWLGRSMNILQASSIIDAVIQRYGSPSIAWFYNGYAFESRVAVILKHRHDAKLILEFEDWHFARYRGLNPKPFLDWFFWVQAAQHFTYSFAVNAKLQNRLITRSVPSQLLPGVISDWVVALREKCPPFRCPDSVTIGYFGGLSREKGAHFLLDIIKRAKPQTRFIVTGKGELESDFAEFTSRFPDRLCFLGSVSDDQLQEAMACTDVVVNAHEYNVGIFPFKVLEAVAIGRLLISTQLPMDGYGWLKDAIEFRQHCLPDFLAAIDSARSIYNCRKTAIDKAAMTAEMMFGCNGLETCIRKMAGVGPR